MQIQSLANWGELNGLLLHLRKEACLSADLSVAGHIFPQEGVQVVETGDLMVAALRSGDPVRLGPYRIEGRLGEGGQGVVFLGRTEDGGWDGAGELRAIKLMHLEADDKAQARFLREVEVAKQVAPFCTARIYDVDSDGDHTFIVSEYVEGPSLQAKVQEDGPLSGAELERLAVGTATALVAIHQAGIIHRDLKPHNVLLGRDGPRVIDFGVAKALSGSTTMTSRVIGTPSYMAPEQVEGDLIGTAADVFCWASTMVYAATGEPPFGQDSIMAVINRIVNHPPELGALDGVIRGLVLDCLAKEPDDRPKTRDLLMRLLGHQEAAPSPVTSQDEPTEMLNAGAALAISTEDHFGYNDQTLWQETTGRHRADQHPLPPVPPTVVPPTVPPRRADRRAKVPWYLTAGALAIAVVTAGGAATVVYNLSNAKAGQSVSPEAPQQNPDDGRKGGKDGAVKNNRIPAVPYPYGSARSTRGATATPTTSGQSPIPTTTKKPQPPHNNPSPDPEPTKSTPSVDPTTTVPTDPDPTSDPPTPTATPTTDPPT
jgi:serine/threonine protein kinase